VAVVSERVRRRIERDFPDPGSAAAVLDLVGTVHESERVQAAVVVLGDGDLVRLRDASDLAQLDWRDVLIRVGFPDEGWPARLDAELSPAD